MNPLINFGRQVRLALRQCDGFASPDSIRIYKRGSCETALWQIVKDLPRRDVRV